MDRTAAATRDAPRRRGGHHRRHRLGPHFRLQPFLRAHPHDTVAQSANPERAGQGELRTAGKLLGAAALWYIENEQLGDMYPVDQGVHGEVELPDLASGGV